MNTESGRGFALVDPHGDLVERIAARIPRHREADVIYLNAPDPRQPYGYNPLRHVSDDRIAAFSRADIPAQDRRDFFVYVDEFQSFTTLALVNLFSELRKYRVGFTVAHQYLHQLEPEIRHAIFGNAGSVISFRVGAEDATYIVQEFHEQYEQLDFLQLPNYRIYLKLMVDGMPTQPFSAVSLAPTALSE